MSVLREAFEGQPATGTSVNTVFTVCLAALQEASERILRLEQTVTIMAAGLASLMEPEDVKAIDGALPTTDEHPQAANVAGWIKMRTGEDPVERLLRDRAERQRREPNIPQRGMGHRPGEPPRTPSDKNIVAVEVDESGQVVKAWGNDNGHGADPWRMNGT